MSSIEIFTRFDLANKEIFDYLSRSSTFLRTGSIFFRTENFLCRNSKIDLDTSFSQKCVFSDLMQLFCKVQEISENEKISIKFDGLVKGLQSFNFIKDEESCILRESIKFSLYNNFNFFPIEIFLASIFYIDLFVRHLRLKNLVYKELSSAGQRKNSLIDFSEIRTYIVIDSNIGEISSLIADLNKFALLLSPFTRMRNINENEFLIDFLVPFLPELKCSLFKSKSNVLEISFSNKLVKGKNIFKLFPLEKKLVIENTICVEGVMQLLKLFWLITGNTFVRNELNSWNRRLKEVVEKTALSKYLKEAFSTT